MPGSGKTATGKILARDLSKEFIDTDSLIEQKAQKKIREIFARDGEETFRDLETDTLIKVSGSQDKVVGTGGGIVLRERNWELMEMSGKVIYLKTSPEWVLKRTTHSEKRPLLNVPDQEKGKRVEDLLQTRAPYYEKADFICDTDGKTPEEVAKEIEKHLK